MKFTQGYWRMREGVKAYWPVEVHEVEIKDNTIIVYGATKHISDRGDTLNLPLITVSFSSPIENVIRVQIWHHKGSRLQTPRFEINQFTAPLIKICNNNEVASLTSGFLTVSIRKKGEWLVEFKDKDRVITNSGPKCMGFVDTKSGRFIHEKLLISVGECVYGLGERFTPFVKNGQTIDMWNEDGGTCSEYAYKNIPFYITNRGYGVFVNHPEQVSFEVGSELVSRVQFSVPGEYLEYFLIYGPSPKDVIKRYTALTGKPALPPAWSFGLWLTTSFTTSYDEETATSFIQGMADRDIPLHVFHFDCFWMKEFHWCDFEWDSRTFPDPVGMLKRLKTRGLKICVWINPYIAQNSKLFEEGAKYGYLLKKTNGDIWQTDDWQAGMAIVDFTNPAACQWFSQKLRALIDMGVDCFKTDFGECIPVDVVYFDGSDPIKMHNYYTYLYNKIVFETLKDKFGEGKALVFARSATAGSQRFPVHWGGDCTATYESMAETLRGGLSLSLCGFGFWSHDISGFEKMATPDLYKRWCAFGLLSSHSRLHGSSSYRVPWLFDDEAVDVLRFFTKLKCRLMPYIFGAACEAHKEGIPVMRPMMLEFPDDPACYCLDRQYMLGSSLLIAPVFSPDGTVQYYLPGGRWTNFISNQVVEGGRWVEEKHDYMSLPVMVRPNSIIPVGSVDNYPDYHYAQDVVFHIFELEEGRQVSCTVPSAEGHAALKFIAERSGLCISISTEGYGTWHVLLRNIYAVKAIEDGSMDKDAFGVFIKPHSNKIKIVLEDRN